MNEGKKFESDFRNSISKKYLLYRIPDSAQSFDKTTKLRFSSKSPFDYIMWDSNNRVLFALELKTVQGKSISFERTERSKGNIHWHQIQGLIQWSKYDGIRCGFIINFRELEETIFLDIRQFNTVMHKIQKKSFTISDLISNGIVYISIPQTKRKTRYKYDISPLIENTALLEGKHDYKQ